MLLDELHSPDEFGSAFAVVEPLLAGDEGDRGAGEEASEPAVERDHGPGGQDAAGLRDDVALLLEPAVHDMIEIVAATLAGVAGTARSGLLDVRKPSNPLGSLVQCLGH